MNKILNEAFECPECKQLTLFLIHEIIAPINGNVGYTYQCENLDCEHNYSV